MKTHRKERVAEVIREVAAETILFELSDPRVKMVTVTRAEVSGDLQHAKVYVSIMGSPGEQKLTMHGLKHAAGFVQSKLAARMKTRFTPLIQFVLDKGVKQSIEIARLINEALGKTAGAQETEATDEDESPDEDAEGTADDRPAMP
jgi:ribosome-binding factor A